MYQRGLYQDNYFAFEKGLPVKLDQPLGTRTFKEEHESLRSRSMHKNKNFTFGGIIPPDYTNQLFLWRHLLTRKREGLVATWLFRATYKRTFPAHPLNDKICGRATADVLIALSFESDDKVREKIKESFIYCLSKIVMPAPATENIN
jgi:hypothetical protein